MRAWNELTATALEGTSKSASGDDAERRLLGEAGWHTLRRLAGVKPATIVKTEGEPAPEETRPLVSRAAASRLEEILRGEDRAHLEEWLEIAASAGKRVPASLLPPLLDFAAVRGDVRPALLRVGGARVSWVAHQNEEWAFADIADPLEAFHSGVRAARVAALTEMRRADPAAALALLAQGWDREGGDDRAALIAALEVGLGPGDEQFLAAATGDGRKEVRGAARDLLARLPESALIARMIQRADSWIRFSKGVLGSKLVVEPPAECDAALIADGIEPKPPKGMGERAHWLRQVVALVPPSHWPAGILERGASSEWSQPLLTGWTDATVRFRDATWARALIQHNTKDIGATQRLAHAMPRGALDDVIQAYLQRTASSGIQLAIWTAHPLSPQLSAAIVQALRRALGQRTAQTATDLIYSIAPLKARLDVSILPQVIELAGMTTVEYPARTLQSLAATLEYRAAMAKEIMS